MANHLADFEIATEMAPRVTPWEPSNINPASLDLRLSDQWIDLNEPHCRQNIFSANYLDLYPNDAAVQLHNYLAGSYVGQLLHWKPKYTLVLAMTLERISLPDDIAAVIYLKTTPCRWGLDHPIAGWIDPGFQGNLTLMLHAHHPIRLSVNMRICQLVFSRLSAPCKVPYGVKGHYQGITEPTRAWIHHEYQVD